MCLYPKLILNRKYLPKYYRNKIYTEEERELLWIQKLAKTSIENLISQTMTINLSEVHSAGHGKNELLHFAKARYGWELKKP